MALGVTAGTVAGHPPAAGYCSPGRRQRGGTSVSLRNEDWGRLAKGLEASLDQELAWKGWSLHQGGCCI